MSLLAFLRYAALSFIVVVTLGRAGTPLLASQTPVYPAPPAHAQPATAMDCAAAAQQTLMAIDEANRRIDAVRQINNPQQVRAAVDEIQLVLADLKTRLGICATQTQSPAHGAALPPGTPVVNPGSPLPAPGAAGLRMDHQIPGHGAAPATPGHPSAGAALGAPPAGAAGAPTAGAQAPTVDHAGHAAPAQSTPAQQRQAESPTTQPAPSRPDHAGHADPQSAPVSGRRPTGAKEKAATDPDCQDRIDRRTAPNATFLGRTYYFCSEEEKQEFLKAPVDYIRKKK
jgi:YHS domain-containing protein